MQFTKFAVLWDLSDAEEGVEPPHVLPLALKRDQYETEEEYEKDVLERLEALGGHPVVGFMVYEHIEPPTEG